MQPFSLRQSVALPAVYPIAHPVVIALLGPFSPDNASLYVVVARTLVVMAVVKNAALFRQSLPRLVLTAVLAALPPCPYAGRLKRP